MNSNAIRMNESSASKDSLTETEIDTTTAPETDASGDILRRRRRRRRRRSAAKNTPTQRIHYFLLGVIGLLIVLSLLGPQFRQQAIGSLRHLLPHVAVDLGRRFEVIALVVAGLILLYLTPGVEDKVLRLLGIRKEKKKTQRR